jgi:hypothetical protein
MSQANVRIDIASEFTGRRAFQQAESATNSLDKAVTKLGKKLTSAFSAYKIAQYAKASVKAFAEDNKAAAVLAKTLENVNQGYATDMVNAYIAKTEALYGVLDDKLRPAFSQLVIATGDATKSQQLLQTALDVSAGTGKDLESVTTALSKAYLGNTTALQRLGVGLSSAELKGKSFDQIITTLNQNFSGQAAIAADTYGGKLDRLNVALKNMQETIGKGIIEALGQLNTDQGFNGVITKIGSLAQDISDIIVGLGIMINKLQSIPGAGVIKNILSASFNTGLFGIAKKLGSKDRTSKAQPSVVTGFLNDMNKIAAATAKTNTTAKSLLTTAKGLTKEAKDKAMLDALSLKYLQAAKIFNEEQIQIAAALQNKALSAEDQIRVNLKKDILDLETAIQNKDIEGATALAAKIDLEYKQLGLYQSAEKAVTSIADILKNLKPMDLINIQNLQDALALLLKLNVPLTPQQQAQASQAQAKVDQAITTILATDLPNAMAEMDVTSYLGVPFNPNVPSNYGVGNPNLQNVQVTIVDNTSGLIDVITDATQQGSANGVNTRILRNTGNLNW